MSYIFDGPIGGTSFAEYDGTYVPKNHVQEHDLEHGTCSCSVPVPGKPGT